MPRGQAEIKKALTFVSSMAYRYEINALQLTRRQAHLFFDILS